MRCFHVTKDQITGDQIKISGSELHHLLNVLRLHEGDRITLLDGEGGIYESIITSINEKIHPPTATCKIESSHRSERQLIEVNIFQGLPKFDKMEFIIQKATEIGVNMIIPVKCHHTVSKLSMNKVNNRVVRWRQIAIEASKQSFRPFFPRIHEIITFDEAIEKSSADLKLIFIAPSCKTVSIKPLKEVLRQNSQAKKIDIFIGPEGDFSKEEIQKALSAGLIPVSLGNNILRTETASIVALAIILYEKCSQGM